MEALLSPARKRARTSNYRSILFDTYLAVEGLVMRHEHDVVGLWRYNHPEIILECSDAFAFGGYQSNGPIRHSTECIDHRLGEHL